MLDSNSYIDLKYPSLYKCDVCKTAFISPFTLATHQLYSCPVTCAFVLEDSAPEGTKNCSEDEPESSDDEGKLKIVERTSKSRGNRCSNKRSSKIKKVGENCASSSKSLKTAGEDTELSCNNTSENHSFNTSSHLKEVPAKELGQKSNSCTSKRRDVPSCTSQGACSKTTPYVPKMRHSDQKIKTPLKVLLKIKASVENAVLPGKTGNVVKLANFSTTMNVGNLKHSHTVAAREDSTAQETTGDGAVKGNENAGEICNSCASNDVLKNNGEFAVGEENKNAVALKHGEFNTI